MMDRKGVRQFPFRRQTGDVRQDSSETSADEQEVNMFKIGDQVVHYKEGVCEVTNIGRLDIRCSDRKKEYYTLKPLYNTGGTLYMPVNGEEKQLRKVISQHEAKELIDDMPNIDVLDVSDEKRREVMYKEALFKNQCRSWVALMKTSYIRKMERIAVGKKVINVDDRYLNSAEKFLYGELAVALDMPKDKVREYIVDKMEP